MATQSAVGNQAGNIVDPWTEIGRRLTNALTYAGRTERTPLVGDHEILEAELRQEEDGKAKTETEKDQPGDSMFTEWSRLDSSVVVYSMVGKRGQTWVGIKTHLVFNQEAYDAARTTLVRALESASRR